MLARRAFVLPLALLGAAPLPAAPAGQPVDPTVAFASAASQAPETAGTVHVSVVLSSAALQDVTLPYSVSGTAGPLDATIPPSPLVIPAGLASWDIPIQILDDTEFEGPETVVLTLGTPANAVLGSPSVHTLTILDDEPPPVLSFQSAASSVPESAGQVDVRLLLSPAVGVEVIAPFTLGGAANSPEDYTIGASPIVIPAWATFVDLPVDIVDDDEGELDERVRIVLAAPTNAVLGAIDQHALTILDDDGAVLAPPPSIAPLPLEWVPTSVDVGVARIGGPPVQTVVQVLNDTGAQAQLTGLAAAGANAGDFLLTAASQLPILLPDGGSTPVTIHFQPTVRGSRSAKAILRQRPISHMRAVADLTGTAIGPTGEEILVNSGGLAYDATTGDPYSADYGFSTPSTVQGIPTGPIGNTNDPELYRSCRVGAAYGYAFDLPAGLYEVTLHFAELVHTSAGQRIFDVALEGQTAIDDLDLYGLVGFRRAHVEVHEVAVLDGRLEVDLSASAGEAMLSAIEVRSVPNLRAVPPALDFGTLDVGAVVTLDLTLRNVGLHTAHIDTLAIDVGEDGDARDFSVEVGGHTHYGNTYSTLIPIDVTLPPSGSAVAKVTFAPSGHSFQNLQLRFLGNFDTLGVPLKGGAGFGGDPYLHPVIAVQPVVVDFDDDGREDVYVDGTDSHTHEPGHLLTAWIWRRNGLQLSALEEDWLPLAQGPHTLELEIRDDNQPPRVLATTADLQVVPSGSVPGALALYYDPVPLAATPAQLLDMVPANPDFAEVLGQGLRVTLENGVGASGFQGNVMVRVLAKLQVGAAGQHAFAVSGGAAHRLLVDGQPYTAPLALAAGSHALEVRWAVDTLAQLPLALTISVDGGPHQQPPVAALTHDVKAVPPVVNAMPDVGIVTGGNHIVISGFGFFTKPQVTVQWGPVDLTLQDFLVCEPDRIEFLSPPGSGFIDVAVETPQGISNTRVFEYRVDGPVPIVFANGPELTLAAPTAGAWGPDGRLYVTTRGGELKAITFNAAYNATAVDTYPGVSSLPNHEVMGIAFNPFDPPSPVRVYLSHTHMYAQGGGTFTGPAPYPGVVSVLQGPAFDAPQPLITGLPTSNHDHGVNGLEFDHNGDLLLAVGGNTNAGIKWWKIGDLHESPLTAAILKARTSKPGFQGAIQYVETATGLPNDDQVFGNVVDVAPGSDVLVYATGLRNTFDFTLATWGELYATDNGPNTTYGPASTGPNSQSSSHPYDLDELLRIRPGRYYGHPNRNRGRTVAVENNYYNTNTAPNTFYTPPMTTLPPSTNGVVEYRSNVFNGEMRGDLLAMKYAEQLRRIELTADKSAVTAVTVLTPWMNGLNVVTGPGGALLSIDYLGNKLRVFTPQESYPALALHDITPWRAPAGGGTPFVLGGANFGTLATTRVEIGGVLAQLSSVTPTRVHGVVPARPDPPLGLVDVTVTVGSAFQVLQQSFQYLPATPGLWQGTWTAGPSMPVPLGEVACGMINGQLYLVGEGSSQTLRYSLGSKTWATNLPVRPFVGHHHAAEVHNGRWYLIGGLGAGAGKVQIFDPATNAWSLGADMPWAGGSVSTALIQGRIYAAGGIVGSTTVDNCAVYDPAANTWTPLASMAFQKGRNHAAAGSDGRKLWIFGGRGIGSGASNVVANGFADVQVYDPATNTWATSFDGVSALTPMPIGRGGTGKAVFHQGEFYVFGGETLNGQGAQPGNVYSRVDVYDPSDDTWRTDAPMPTPRHGIFPVVHQGRVFLAGGGTVAGFSQSSVMEIFERP